MAEYQLIPSKTALVNVDMQNAFVEGTRCPRPTVSLCCPWSTAWPLPAETPG
jgi:nicotinamidase-related amidase